MSNPTKVPSPQRPKSLDLQFNQSYHESQLSGTYTEDLNVLEIHGRVVQYINDANDFNLRHQMNISESSCGSEVKQKIADNIEELKKKTNLGKYITESKEILEYFSKTSPVQEVSVFGRKTVATPAVVTASKDRDSRLNMISKYLEIARRYAPVKFHYNKIETVCCSSCGNPELSGEECSDCGMIQGADIVAESLKLSINPRKINIQGNIKKSILNLSDIKIDEQKLNKYIELIEPFMSGVSLPGRYLAFKIEEQDSSPSGSAGSGKCSPELMGLRVSNKTLKKYDDIWETVVQKVQKAGGKITFYKSF